MPSNAKQCIGKQSNEMQCQAKQSKAMQCRVKENTAKPSNATQSNAMHSKPMQSNARRSNAYQIKAIQQNALNTRHAPNVTHASTIWHVPNEAIRSWSLTVQAKQNKTKQSLAMQTYMWNNYSSSTFHLCSQLSWLFALRANPATLAWAHHSNVQTDSKCKLRCKSC